MPHRARWGRIRTQRDTLRVQDIPTRIWAVTPADIRTAWVIPEGTLRGCRRGIRRALRAAE